jgi:hypothetical protein
MYAHKIEELRVAEVLAKDQYSRAVEFLGKYDSFHAEKNFERAQKLHARARRCNDVLMKIKGIAGSGDISAIVNDMLANSDLSVDEMEAVLWHAPEWGNHLYTSALHHPEKPASLYQIEILRKSDGEAFYKVGHTGADLNRRINALGICRKTYSVSIHHSFQFRKKRFAEFEEKRIHDNNVHLRYMGAPFLDNGHTEVYSTPLLSNRLLLEISLYSLLGISRD